MEEKRNKEKQEKKRRKGIAVVDIPTDVNVDQVQPMVEVQMETAPNATVHSIAPEQEIELPIIPDAVPPVVVKKCPARELIDSMDDAEESDMDDNNDDDDGSDDEELDAGGGVPTARKRLYSAEKLVEIVAMCREYCELGLRGMDMSHAELSAAKINFARQFFICGQLEEAYEDGKSEIEEWFTWDFNIGGYSHVSWSASFVNDFLLNGVQAICTIPFRDIVMEGYGQNFIEKMPQMLWLMSHYKRLKVARSYLILLGAFDRYRTKRPDILRFYLSNACSFNGLYIELFNSLANRALPQNMTITTADITNASARVVVKHSIVKASREEHNLKVTSSSNGQGETRTEENKCNAITSRPEADRIRKWLVGHMQRLKAIKTAPSERTEGAVRWENMNKISGLIERGKNITNLTVIPDYVKYLKKMKDEQRRSREAEYLTKYEKLLNKNEMTIGFLKVAIAAKGEIVKQQRLGGNPSMKEFCVGRVLHHYETYREFKSFVTLHDLSRNNQQTLLLQFENEIKNPRIIANNEAEN
jgi:hypothetical protein